MTRPPPPALPASPLPGLRTVELDASWEAPLQRFFDRNPLYFETATGKPAQPTDARDEIHDTPPEGWSYGRLWLIGLADAQCELAAMASVVSDLLASGVWHMGLYIVATERHGSGDAQRWYQTLESWCEAAGASWVRLGVIRGNSRAERFWQRQGFVQTRLREGVVMGERTHTIRVMVKPLGAATVAQYLEQVERDRPPVRIEAADAPEAASLEVVDAGLEAHNSAVVALADVRPLAAFATDEAGKVVGGAVGRTWGECCELLQLWVAPEHRGAGTGAALLEAFEARARQRGCVRVYLSTFSFQAPDFYLRRGYAVQARIAGYTGGVVKYLLIKNAG